MGVLDEEAHKFCGQFGGQARVGLEAADQNKPNLTGYTFHVCRTLAELQFSPWYPMIVLASCVYHMLWNGGILTMLVTHMDAYCAEVSA